MDIKVYSLDVDNKLMRGEDSIPFDDERLRCIETPDGRECRYLCTEAENLELILPPE